MKGSDYIIDPKSYKPVAQAMAVVKGWKANSEAVRFMKYVVSPECKPIFEKYGYIESCLFTTMTCALHYDYMTLGPIL
jgi:ABC-type molybdate transport system substrate-binding protein